MIFESLIILTIISFVLARLSWVISERNVGVIWNGFGAVQNVLDKTADAPMAYRILMPLLLSKVTNQYRLVAYFIFSWILTFGMLMTSFLFFGLKTTLILALLIPITIRYDYWDWVPELGGIISCISGNLPAAIIWSILMSLSRETSIILPIVWFVSGFELKYSILLAAIIGVIRYGIFRWQGNKKKYCETIMLDRNGKELKEWMSGILAPIYLTVDAWQNPLLKNSKGHIFFDDMTISVILSAAGLFAIGHFGLPFGIPIIMFLVAGWTFAIARENRVFSPILFYIALWLNQLN